MKQYLSAVLWVATAAFAQAPSPVVSNTQNGGGSVPIFKVDVTSKTVLAVNYHHRKGTTKIDFRGTALMPEARGEAEVTPNDGATRVSLRFEKLSNPTQYGPEFLTLVLWAITPEGRAERMGEVTLRDGNDTKSELYATTDLQSFGMIVTAEPYFNVSQPSDVVVMENIRSKETTGTLEGVDAKYELLKRGQYTLNVDPMRLKAVTADTKVPLQLREARQAIAIAKAQGADTYAADTMQRAAVALTNAEGYQRGGKDLKMLETSAREATQFAEDARRISIEKIQEQNRQALLAREAEARAKAEEESRLRSRAEADAANAEAQRKQAEAATREAEAARQMAAREKAAALSAKAEADRARAEAEQARLEAEKAKGQAESDAKALRARLLEQFNAILATRDTARGLIVNMSDVLFGFNKADLQPGAKEKLAKVSGIMLAYPQLRMSVEGHTDSIGSDEYNQGLSERRANAVRAYLISNGIAPDGIQAMGFGKSRPVADNGTESGRQQNRRVELVVSGDIIGQPLGGPETSGSGSAQLQR